LFHHGSDTMLHDEPEKDREKSPERYHVTWWAREREGV